MAVQRKKVKKKKQPATDKAVVEARKKNERIVKNARKRGNLVDFTRLKLGSLTDRNRKIVKCAVCGLKGEKSNALGATTLILHRGISKLGDTHSNGMPRIRMTVFCVGG